MAFRYFKSHWTDFVAIKPFWRNGGKELVNPGDKVIASKSVLMHWFKMGRIGEANEEFTISRLSSLGIVSGEEVTPLPLKEDDVPKSVNRKSTRKTKKTRK